MTKTERLMELMSTVYERKRFTAQELADEFGVSYRTMLRYLQELSGMGVPLYAEPGRSGGYSLLARRDAPRAAAPEPPLVRKLFKPASLIVGLEVKVPFTAVFLSDAIIPRLWDEWLAKRQAIPDLRGGPGGRLTGAVLGRSRVYHYIAGVEAPAGTPVPEGLAGLALPPKAYAVYLHQGTYRRDGRDDTYFHALDKLRAAMQEDHDPDAYALESYAASAADGGMAECEIYIPLK